MIGELDFALHVHVPLIGLLQKRDAYRYGGGHDDMVDAVQEVVRLRAAFDANACIPKLTDFVAEFFFFLRIADNDFRAETLCELRRRHAADTKPDYQNFFP